MTDKSSPPDYQHEVQLYLSTISDGISVSQKVFCEQRSKELGKSVSLSTFEKALRRYRKDQEREKEQSKAIEQMPDVGGRRNWAALKVEFMRGQWDTIAGFIKAKNIRMTSHIRKTTNGWIQAKEAFRARAAEIAADKLLNDCAEDLIIDTQKSIRGIYLGMLQGIKTMSDGLKNLKVEEVCTAEEIYFTARGIKALCEAAEKIEPRINAMERMAEFSSIMGNLESGAVTIDSAILRFIRLGIRVPRAMEIMLSRPAEEIPPDDAEIISVEKIMENRKEIYARLEQQRLEFVPQRMEEVRELKNELADKDSFAAQKLEDGDHE